MQQVLAVIFVLLALWGAVAFLRKNGFAIANGARGTRNRTPAIQQLDRLRLTPTHSIHLLRVDDIRILIGVHPQGISLLETPQSGALTRHTSKEGVTGA